VTGSKRWPFAAAAWMAGAAWTAVGFAQSPPLVCPNSTMPLPSYSDSGLQTPTSASLPATETHPSVYFDDTRVATLKSRTTEGGYYGPLWARMQADIQMDRFGPTNDDQGNSCRAKGLAFSYRVTGNSALLAGAVTALKAAFAGGIPATEDDTAVDDWLQSYSEAYDWVQPTLSTEDDAAIRKNVKVGASWLFDWFSTADPRPQNHRSKAGSALGTWALTFRTDPDAQTWLNFALDAMAPVFGYQFTPDGIYRDGGGYYFVFTLINLIPFMWQLRNVTGTDMFPALRPAFDWAVKVREPRGWIPNWQDSWEKSALTHLVAPAFKDVSGTPFHPTAPLSSIYQWAWLTTDWAGIAYTQSVDGNTDWSGAGQDLYFDPDEFILFDSTIGAVQPTLNPTQFMTGGHVYFRNNWNTSDPTTSYLFFQGAGMTDNHNHCDSMEYLIDAEGAIMVNDSGYGPEQFNDDGMYRNIYGAADRHNSITADGVGPQDATVARSQIDIGTFAFAEKQAPFATGATMRRAIAFPQEQYFVVADQMTAPSSQTFVSYLRARGSLDLSGNQATWTTPNDTYGSPARLVTTVLPANLSIATPNDGVANFYGSDPSDAEPNAYLAMTQQGTSALYLTVLIPAPTSGEVPVTQDFSGGGALAATVTDSMFRDTFIHAAAPATATAQDLTADALFACSHEVAQGLANYMLEDGTSLSYGGMQIFAANAPTTLAVDLSLAGEINAQVTNVSSPTTLTFYTRPDLTIQKATFDGTAIPVQSVSGGGASVALSSSGTLVLSEGGDGGAYGPVGAALPPPPPSQSKSGCSCRIDTADRSQRGVPAVALTAFIGLSLARKRRHCCARARAS